MKIVKEKEDFKQMNSVTLQEQLVVLKKELMNVRLSASTMHIKDYSQFKKLRRSIARVKTYIQQKEQS